MNTVPPNDFSYFEMINDLVQKEPVGALDPEIMGSLAAIGIVKGKPFNPDARMKKILTDAAAIGTAAARTLDWRPRPAEGFSYYPNSAWTITLWVGGYNFETPPPEVSATGAITVNPPTGARTLNSRTAIFFYATYITPAMIMRLTGIGSQYIGAFVDSNGEYFDGGKTYKMTLPPKVPAEKFWSLTVYDNQTRSMLDTPQRYPRAGSQSYPTPAAEPNADGSTTVYFGPSKPDGVKRGNWIQTMPGKGWSTLLRLYSPLEPFFTKAGGRARSNSWQTNSSHTTQWGRYDHEKHTHSPHCCARVRRDHRFTRNFEICRRSKCRSRRRLPKFPDRFPETS